MPLTISHDSGTSGAIFTPKVYANGDLKFATGSVSFDNSYPSNGETMDLSNYFNVLLGVIFETKAGYVFEYDYAAGKAKAYYGKYSAAADGALVEVANLADLSAIVGVRFLAWGY
jgi:hypothetical protein